MHTKFKIKKKKNRERSLPRKFAIKEKIRVIYTII